MNRYIQDTIAAIATAPGAGGIGIIRVSGPDAEAILTKVFHPAGSLSHPLPSHMLTYGSASDGNETIDECMAVMMRAPRSYTREDVCELHVHGGSYVTDRVLTLCLRAGARLAEPGEFTRRAFLNGRIDLTQAEGVMGMIAAGSEAARRAAARQLDGGVCTYIRRLLDRLNEAAAGLAACVDYPEEVSDEEAIHELKPALEEIASELLRSVNERTARILGGGLQVVLCGRPNAGKSSLLNTLLEEDRAIVTEIPGTTRDVLTGTISLGGSTVVLTDTAGLRDSDDPVERIGVERSHRAMEQADTVLYLLDSASPLSAEDRAQLQTADPRWIILMTKADLPSVIVEEDIRNLLPSCELIRLSCQTGEGIASLRDRLTELARTDESAILSQPRHADAARRAAQHLQDAVATMEAGLPADLCSVDIHAAQLALSEITGDNADEALLDAVFSRFCVGK